MPLPPVVILCTFLAMALLAPSPLTASQPLGLPSPPTFDVLVKSLAETTTDARWQCSPTGDERCDCVEFVTGDRRVAIVGIDDGGAHLRAERLLVRTPTSRFVATDLEFRASQETSTLVFEDAIWSSANGAGRHLLVAKGQIEGVEDEVEIHFYRPVWTSAQIDGLADETDTCTEASQFERDLPGDHWSARAEKLTYAKGEWTADELALDGLAGGVVASRAQADGASAGLLPPTISIYDRGARLTGAYYFGELPLSLEAHIDSVGVGGLGVGTWSSSATCDADRCSRERLGADIFAGTGGVTALYLSGAGAVGSPRRHGSVASDGLAWTASDYDPGRADRLERGRFFRNWNAQLAGLSLGGANHDLSISSALVGETSGGLELGDDQHVVGDLWLRYGTRIDLGEAGRGDLRIGHREFDLESGRTARSTAASVRLDRMLGSTNKIYLRPALRGELTAGVADGVDGTLAGSRTTLDAIVDGGIGLRGHPGAVTHTIMPRIFVGRRIVAIDSLPEQMSTSSDLDMHRRADRPFNFAGTTVEQRFDFGGRRRLQVPVGVVFVDDGRASDWRATSHASLEYSDRRAGRPIVAGVDALCVHWCDNAGIRARLRVRWSDWLQTMHTFGHRLAHRPGPPYFDRRIRNGMVDDGVPFFGDGQHQREVIHSSAIRARAARWNTEWRVFADLQSLSSAGTDWIVEYQWPELGWGLGIYLATVPERGEVAATVGLRNSPVF